MAFPQQTVNRNYTTAFPGEVLVDGPRRARSARISSVNDPAGFNTNHIGRAFGWTGDIPVTGTTNSALEITAGIGATPFAGIAIDPKRYVAYGTSAGGPLAPTYDLPQYTEVELMDMGIIWAELFNISGTASQTVNYGDQVCYVTSAYTPAGGNPPLPLGALVSVAAAGTPATGLVAIPNARVTNAITIASGSSSVATSGQTSIQLTQ